MLVKKQEKTKSIEGAIFENEQKCTCCGQVKDLKHFYKSSSILFKNNKEKRMSICKDCILTIYDYHYSKVNTDINATYLTCQQLDAYFEIKLFESVTEEAEKKKSKVIKIYFTKINSLPQCREKTFADSDNFNMRDIEIKSEVDKQYQNILDKEFIVTPFMIAMWGINKSKEDLMFLEHEYHKLKAYHGCDSPTQQDLFEEISQTRLGIRKKREAGENVDKELATLQSLYTSAGLKKNQKNEANAGLSFTSMIDEWESEEPVPEVSPEFRDVDGIRKLILVFFFGHLCKMLGIKNDYSLEYEEEMKKYRVEKEKDEEEDNIFDNDDVGENNEQ